MILMYHKVDVVTPTLWWVTPEDLERHLTSLSNRQFVYLEDYRSPSNQVVVTFDDAYENVFRHALPVLKRLRRPFEVFVIGDVIGDWNDFDPGEPRTRHMNLDQMAEIAAAGGRIQWHSRSHPDLKGVSDADLEQELEVPEELRREFPLPHFSWFSYPGGSHDDRCVHAASRKFSGAVSVIDGRPDDRWQLNRVTVDRFTVFS
jgi:peptidoglycan/xylan/chitin deacetylase (PgdA/CDA1 family)